MRRALTIAATAGAVTAAALAVAFAAAIGVQWLNLYRIEHAQDGTD